MDTNLNNSIVLTKESTENEIKIYFQKVLELKQSNEEFPINLDEVWMLVYSSKSVAVRALKKDFIENEDFTPVCRNAQRSKSGQFASSSETIYKLSISCMEYFIAKKVRPVFDVYRKVFHKVAEQKPKSQLEILQISINQLIEHENRISSVETKVDSIMQKQLDAEAELKILPVATEAIPELPLRDKIRLLINRYCSATGMFQKMVWDNVYQTLYYSYHISVKSYTKAKNESWIDVAERKGFLDKMYIVVSNLLRDKGLVS